MDSPIAYIALVIAIIALLLALFKKPKAPVAPVERFYPLPGMKCQTVNGQRQCIMYE